MGAWHATYANMLRSRFGALVAYANLLVEDPIAARTLAEDATVAVFSARRSPHDTYEAEVACREWMAAHAESPERAAVVLIAIDSLDDDSVHRVLRKSTPNPLPPVTPEAVAELRARFSQSAAVYAVPSGGVNALLAPARRRHQSAILRTTGGLAAAIVGFVAVAYVGIPFLPQGAASAEAPTASASPSKATITVTWDPQADYEAALAGFHMPECGEKYAPSPRAVGGVTPSPTGQIERDEDFGDFVMLSPGFATEDKGAHWLLADPSLIVVTRDDEVVMTREAEFNGMEVFYANTPGSGGGMGFGRASFCDAQAAGAELERTLGYFDHESATEKERAAYEKEWQKFNDTWAEFEPGVYKIYEVTPMVFGKQAALGQVLKQEGLQQVQYLAYDIAYTPLAEDPRAAPFCTGNYDVGDMECDVPPDVLKELLTREIDPATINDTPPGMGISEPIELDWS